MKTSKILTAAALSGILGLAVAQSAQAAETATEKCYGVVKAAKNDCGSSTHSCAGHAAKDGDAAEWVMTPKGLCEKLVNGSLTPAAGEEMNDGKMMMEEKK